MDATRWWSHQPPIGGKDLTAPKYLPGKAKAKATNVVVRTDILRGRCQAWHLTVNPG